MSSIDYRKINRYFIKTKNWALPLKIKVLILYLHLNLNLKSRTENVELKEAQPTVINKRIKRFPSVRNYVCMYTMYVCIIRLIF